jgi:hypothetical protein
VIDSNEDGFQKSHIKAICSVTGSTKSQLPGYIGEKGIGFKSVFKVAQKVHIQSGLYSFSFTHRPGDGGLGMITPVNEEYLDIPDGIRTRTTLYLIDSCDRSMLREDFINLPDTLLLFLRKLKRFSIYVELPGYPVLERKFSLVEPTTTNRVRIIEIERSSNSISIQPYLIWRHLASNMPQDPARTRINEAEVILAFPLDGDAMPAIENQHTFAFLPLRKAGYKVSHHSTILSEVHLLTS